MGGVTNKRSAFDPSCNVACRVYVCKRFRKRTCLKTACGGDGLAASEPGRHAAKRSNGSSSLRGTSSTRRSPSADNIGKGWNWAIRRLDTATQL